MNDDLTEAQRRLGAIHASDFRGLNADESGDALENLQRLFSLSALVRPAVDQEGKS